MNWDSYMIYKKNTNVKMHRILFPCTNPLQINFNNLKLNLAIYIHY